jgi:4-hydroxy-3-polyprenylbenzoate decarboxylase
LPNADFVIEGYVDPTEPLRDEGPFGDHTGYYTLPEPYPVFHVTAITHRKDAVYPATIVGISPMEDFYIGGASVKLRHLQDELPRDRGHRAAGGRCLPQPRLREHPQDLPVASLQKSLRTAIKHGLWGMGQMMFTKYLVVVDDESLRTATRRARHQRSPLPSLRQHRPATRQHLHPAVAGPVRCARPRHQRNRPPQQTRH